MTWAPEDKLRSLLGESIPADGQDSDTYFSDDEIIQMLASTEGNVNRAAYSGWIQKAAYYAGLVTITEGNALRQMSDLHKHALDMVKLFEKSSSDLVTGRTRIGRIRRRFY